MTHENMAAWRHSLGLSTGGMAAYLGVPGSTYNKWEKGERKPNDAALRLFEVLRLVQIMAPQVHDQLVAKAQAK